MKEMNESTLSEDIADIITRYRNIAVVGLSSKADRPSHSVAFYLKSHGYKIYPVNPNEKEVLGEKCYPDLKSLPAGIELVDVFRRSEFLPQITQDAIHIGAKALWMQEGIINNEAARLAEEAGLKVVMNRCILKELRKLRSE